MGIAGNIELYCTQDRELVFSLSLQGYRVCGASIPDTDKTSFREDICRCFDSWVMDSEDNDDTVVRYGLEQMMMMNEGFISTQIRPIAVIDIEVDKSFGVKTGKLECFFNEWSEYCGV